MAWTAAAGCAATARCADALAAAAAVSPPADPDSRASPSWPGPPSLSRWVAAIGVLLIARPAFGARPDPPAPVEHGPASALMACSVASSARDRSQAVVAEERAACF